MYIKDYPPAGSKGDNAAVTALIGLLICIVSFLIVGPIVGFLFAIPFVQGDLSTLADQFTNFTNYPEFRLPLYIIQGFASAVGLILTPLVFLAIRKEKPVKQFFSVHRNAVSYILTAVVVITFMGFNSLIIDWNAGIQLPHGIEQWAREMEDKGAELTRYLTEIDSFGMFVLAFVVIAVIPGIGEEFVFRGLFQKKITDAGLNPHLAIWIGAILFSLIHLQFYGFVPRMLLGALFGYLYLWSGDLKIAMVAHFVNNAFMLIMVYVYQEGVTDTNIEEPEMLPLATVIIMTIITAALLFFLYNYWKKRQSTGTDWQKVYSTDKEYQAEMVKSVLSESMNAVILNKKDTAYQLGFYEIHVPREDALKALQIIENDIDL